MGHLFEDRFPSGALYPQAADPGTPFLPDAAGRGRSAAPTRPMLKRIRIRGYKSFSDLEVELAPLTVLLGPNASGKSNFLDALQLVSRLGTTRTLKEAFDPPCRGKPLECFRLPKGGIRELRASGSVSFRIEADFRLSDGIVAATERQLAEYRVPKRDRATGQRSPRVREQNLRYRIEVEMLPRSGLLRVADESLAALNRSGSPTGGRHPFFERREDRIHLRREGQAHPIYHDRYLDHTILSMPHYPPHYPHLVAARRELESWRFFYLEPRERMRAANPVREVRRLGLMGEDLAAFLNTLKARRPGDFEAVGKALATLVPGISGIEVEVSEVGEAELRILEHGVSIPARAVSEGTLRLLGLLTLDGVEDAPALVALEEPENGVHPRLLALIADRLRARTEGPSPAQYLVSTHSLRLADLTPRESLLLVRRGPDGGTRMDSLAQWGPLWFDGERQRTGEEMTGDLPVSERLLRGDFDA